MRQKLALVVGARPNFMKAAPLMQDLRRFPDIFDPILVHTGQHYDHRLSQLFFDELKMSRPDIYLGIGSGTHAEQTGQIMIELEKVFLSSPPDLVVVFGDVNSTLAAAVVAAKLCLKLAHVEAGLRSFDSAMPEEINRIVTDRLADFLFVSERSGLVNLAREGIPNEKIFFTGNIMIDSLIKNLEVARKSDILERLKLNPRTYITMTMHRPANVDNRDALAGIMDGITRVSRRMPVIFPCHPRTKKMIDEFRLPIRGDGDALRIINPLGYLEFLKLQSESKFVLTDSGGIQEETTFLGIPCITMRENTERPATVEIGSNVISGTDPEKITRSANAIIEGSIRTGSIPELWDGHTAERIVAVLLEKLTGATATGIPAGSCKKD
ncbi:MAG: UDP-N-acetylglucosamine 2-epimerase (non-hydrolyzing) [Candidatus Zixiibacteriota bacterium]|nr:MAG: UDP-N-acetylglucosamine 2-epimerase (non-hydrolyzing) [candidate division Zixibacteria bacterium]